MLQLISANQVISTPCSRASSPGRRRCATRTSARIWLRRATSSCVANARQVHRCVGTRVIADRSANQRADDRKPFFMDDLAAAHPARTRSPQIGHRGASSRRSLLHDGEWIGNINVAGSRSGRSTRSRHAILQAFADQAAIAIENARLFNDLDAALERQTAMTDVLDAVSTARLDLQPVFDKVAEHADRLCRGTGAMVLVRDGDELLLSAVAGPSPVPIDRVGNGVVPIDDSSITGAAVLRGEIIHIRDWDSEDAAVVRHLSGANDGPPERARRADDARRRGHRHDRVHPRGTRRVHRRRDRPPGDLRRPGRHRGRQRPPAPRDRTAQHRTVRVAGAADGDSEILQLISDNPGNLDAVFQGIVVQAAHLCDADEAGIMRREGDELVLIDSSDPLDQADIGLRVPVSARVDYRRASVRRRRPAPVARDADPGSKRRHRRPVRRRRPLRPDQRQPARGPSVRASPRPDRAGVRRAGGDRHLQRQPVRAARGADPPRRGGERREGLVPRDDEPRDPHADERRDRDERPAARHRPPAAQREFAEIIRSSGESLLGIINDILDFSKIDAGRLELEVSPFDLRACIESAFDLVTEPAARKGMELAFLIDPAVPDGISGDVTRLRQVLVNLLANAVKFTEVGEVVMTVEPGEAPDEIHLAVRDSGIGIPADRAHKLFEEFSQLDSSTTRKYGGTGLGLAVSKRLAELMGGTMWVESVEGEGATFHFTIVAEPADVPSRRAAAGIPSELTGKSVLVVDDNAINRRILDLQTEAWGLRCRSFASAADALADVGTGEHYDLAILDMHMPGMDGLELARRLHADRPDLPLVLYTSLGGAEAADPIFAGVLAKPVKQSQLFDMLVSVLTEAGVDEPATATSAGARPAGAQAR